MCMYIDNQGCTYIQTLEDGTVWEQGFIKKKKINIMSPQGLDVKFYNQGLQICNYGVSATFKQSVKRLLKLKQHIAV